jgi:hypothetical protein
MPARCTDCHKDVAWLVARDRGYHGRSDIKGQSCASCHPEHAGVDFDLIKWPEGSPERFDHGRTGWPLRQSHADLDCEKCHTSKFRTSPAAPLSARKTAGGWTGLESTCTSCHEDVHRGALNQNCAVCHDAGRWAETPGFTHDTTAFPLADKHATVRCDQCHLAQRLAPRRDRQGRLIPIYRPVPHEACADCHADVHRGQFGTTCTRCHTTKGWHQVDKSSFDHDRTAYPLRGRHAGVPCASCHADFSTPEKKKPAFRTCGTCHRDVHNGTATLAGRVVDCDQCHQVSGFSPSSFTVAQHGSSKYPLEGKHQSVTCASCHRKDATTSAAARWGSSRVILRPTFGTCRDCHADLHGGQLAAASSRAECGDCHRVTGWKPSTFDQAAHAKLRLALDGRHGAVECRSCHGTDRKGLRPLPATPLGKAAFFFKLPEVECGACHVDPHRGRFATAGPRAQANGCLGCHDTRAFRPSTADISAHASYGFALDGAHRATACVSCHAEMKPAAAPPRSTLIAAGVALRELRFESAKTECADCHQTPHGSQFAGRRDGGRCDSCHRTDGFAPATRFDHSRDASFSTKGAHERVLCNQCHPADPNSSDPGARIYRPISGKCESCHGKETR